MGKGFVANFFKADAADYFAQRGAVCEGEAVNDADPTVGKGYVSDSFVAGKGLRGYSFYDVRDSVGFAKNEVGDDNAVFETSLVAVVYYGGIGATIEGVSYTVDETVFCYCCLEDTGQAQYSQCYSPFHILSFR
ncbi:hypothetical protein Barb4_03809 [Bacteroidales bacterium Barb4]|nr:hypothetical protein Barb4_03809 [Bacteroidales bacterium Barb4]